MIAERKKSNTIAEINETENQKQWRKIDEIKSWFFEKINKICKSLAQMIWEEDTNDQYQE